MREILFRGKHLVTNKWVYGNYQHTDCYKGCNDYIGQNKLEHMIHPETLGQYTGLTDKNGKKIFEGDIIKHYNGDPEHEYVISVIVWNIDICKFQKRNLDGLSYGISKECGYEVIGNIHDNPELLK